MLLQVVLAEYGLGAAALYYLAPALLGGFVGSLRGFAGEVTAAQALDLVGSDGGAVLIDIRTEVGVAADRVCGRGVVGYVMGQQQGREEAVSRCECRKCVEMVTSSDRSDGSCVEPPQRLPAPSQLCLCTVLSLFFPLRRRRRRRVAWLTCLVAARAGCWRLSTPSQRTGSCADSSGTHQPLRHRCVWVFVAGLHGGNGCLLNACLLLSCSAAPTQFVSPSDPFVGLHHHVASC